MRYGGLRSFKVIETGTNQKPECDVLLVFHRNDHYLFIYFYLRQGGYAVRSVCLSVLSDIIPACDRQTDRRTDRRTSCHGIVRAVHTRRAVKIEKRNLKGFQVIVEVKWKTGYKIIGVIRVLFRKRYKVYGHSYNGRRKVYNLSNGAISNDFE